MGGNLSDDEFKILETKKETKKSNKKKVITAAYIILKNVINEEKGIFIKNIVTNSEAIERFDKWLQSMY